MVFMHVVIPNGDFFATLKFITVIGMGGGKGEGFNEVWKVLAR